MHQGQSISAKFLLGSAAGSRYVPAYNADVVIDGNHNYINNSSFIYLYTSSGAGPVYNYQKLLNSTAITNGLNNFYVQFNATNQSEHALVYNNSQLYNTITVPLGIANDTIPFNDIAGIGRPGPGNTGVLYNLDTGTISATAGRTVSWASLQNNFNYDTSTPFELTGILILEYWIGSCINTEYISSTRKQTF